MHCGANRVSHACLPGLALQVFKLWGVKTDVSVSLQICFKRPKTEHSPQTRNSLISQLDNISLQKRQFRVEAKGAAGSSPFIFPKVKRPAAAEACYSGLSEY